MVATFEKTHYDECPVCSSSSTKSWRVKDVVNNIFNLDLCSSCGYSFVNPRPSLNFLMDYYSAFGHAHDDISNTTPDYHSVLRKEENYPNSTIDAKRLIKTISNLTVTNSNNKFLDVGCGYGFFSKQAIDSGFDVSALELADNERKIATDMTGVKPTACSFEDYECAPESLSVVFMSQILEHALDVNLWINKSRDFLIDDGIIAIAVPNYGSIFRMIMQENEPFICPPAHLNFFNPTSLSNLLENHGFKVEKVQWVSRLPTSTYEKRLPKYAKPLLPIINIASRAVLKIIDTFHLGMIINVYARKIPD